MYLVIRADATKQTGWGHVMRCLALAEAWTGGDVTFYGNYDRGPVDRILAGGFNLVPAHRRLLTWEIGEPVWYVLDGYHFTVEDQRTLKAAGGRLLVLDDMANLPVYDADIILNQNAGAERLTSQYNTSARLLLGPRYFLLRSEFEKWRDWNRTIVPVARNVLVAFGGSDAGKVAMAKVRRALEGLDLVVRIPDGETPMGELYEWADLMVCAPSVTALEGAYMQLPMVLLATADNQEPGAMPLDRAGVARHLGRIESATDKAIRAIVWNFLGFEDIRWPMSNAGRALVDGGGPTRVVDVMLNA